MVSTFDLALFCEYEKIALYLRRTFEEHKGKNLTTFEEEEEDACAQRTLNLNVREIVCYLSLRHLRPQSCSLALQTHDVCFKCSSI